MQEQGRPQQRGERTRRSRYREELGRFWWVTSDCCGVVCMAFTLLLHVFAYIVQIQFVIRPWLGLSWHAVLYTVLAGLAVYSHR